MEECLTESWIMTRIEIREAYAIFKRKYKFIARGLNLADVIILFL